MANASFYKTFQVTREETEGARIYDIGNGQWDIDKLKVLLEKIKIRGTDVPLILELNGRRRGNAAY